MWWLADQCPRSVSVTLSSLGFNVAVHVGAAKGVAATSGGQGRGKAGSVGGVRGGAFPEEHAGGLSSGLHCCSGSASGFGSLQGGRSLADGPHSCRSTHLPPSPAMCVQLAVGS